MTDDILTIEEVAKYLRVSERTVYDWAQKGEIPSGKIGTVWRFKKSEIEKWVNDRLSSGSRPVVPTNTIQVKNILSPDRILFLNHATKHDALVALASNLSTAPQIKNAEELTFENENIQALKIDYDASTEEYVSAEINVTGAGVTEEYETLTLNIYLYGEGTRMLRIFGKCTDSRVYLALSSVYALEPGWNSIVINVSDFGVAVSGMLEYMRLNLIGGDSCSLALGTLDLMG